ncbi:MAG: hypothetical protein D8B60_09960 [Moraxella sp.]|nr:MAG: hypothetical protein D8B60_09960 [Moraxella sp.]
MTSITPEQAKAAQAHFQKEVATSISELISENKKQFKLMQDGEVVVLKSNNTSIADWDVFLLISRIGKELHVKGVPLNKSEQVSGSREVIFDFLVHKASQGQSIFELVYNLKKDKITSQTYDDFSSVITH